METFPNRHPTKGFAVQRQNSRDPAAANENAQRWSDRTSKSHEIPLQPGPDHHAHQPEPSPTALPSSREDILHSYGDRPHERSTFGTRPLVDLTTRAQDERAQFIYEEKNKLAQGAFFKGSTLLRGSTVSNVFRFATLRGGDRGVDDKIGVEDPNESRDVCLVVAVVVFAVAVVALLAVVAVGVVVGVLKQNELATTTESTMRELVTEVRALRRRAESRRDDDWIAKSKFGREEKLEETMARLSEAVESLESSMKSEKAERIETEGRASKKVAMRKKGRRQRSATIMEEESIEEEETTDEVEDEAISRGDITIDETVAEQETTEETTAEQKTDRMETKTTKENFANITFNFTQFESEFFPQILEYLHDINETLGEWRQQKKNKYRRVFVSKINENFTTPIQKCNASKTTNNIYRSSSRKIHKIRLPTIITHARYYCEDFYPLLNDDSALAFFKDPLDNSIACYVAANKLPYGITHSEAKNFCYKFGGFLIQVQWTEKANFLRDLLRFASVNNGYWLGMTKRNDWMWTNSSTRLNYSNWNTNYAANPNHLCASVSINKTDETTGWRTSDCAALRRPICQFERYGYSNRYPIINKVNRADFYESQVNCESSNSKCFRFFRTQRSFSTAERICRQRRLILAKRTDLSNTILLSILKSIPILSLEHFDRLEPWWLGPGTSESDHSSPSASRTTCEAAHFVRDATPSEGEEERETNLSGLRIRVQEENCEKQMWFLCTKELNK